MTRNELIKLSAKYNQRDSELLIRSYDTLFGNVYGKDENFLWSPYRCITPARGFFFGIWNWDRAFSEELLNWFMAQHK